MVGLFGLCSFGWLLPLVSLKHSGGGRLSAVPLVCDPSRGQHQAGSLTGAVHLSKGNAGVPRPAHRGQKPRVEQKGKCWPALAFQWEDRP